MSELAEFFEVTARRIRALGEELECDRLVIFVTGRREDGKKAATTLQLTSEGMGEACREREGVMRKVVSIGHNLCEVAWVREAVRGYLTLAGVLRYLNSDMLDVDGLRAAHPEAGVALDQAMEQDSFN